MTAVVINHRLAPLEHRLVTSRRFTGDDSDSNFFKRDFSSEEIDDGGASENPRAGRISAAVVPRTCPRPRSGSAVLNGRGDGSNSYGSPHIASALRPKITGFSLTCKCIEVDFRALRCITDQPAASSNVLFQVTESRDVGPAVCSETVHDRERLTRFANWGRIRRVTLPLFGT